MPASPSAQIFTGKPWLSVEVPAEVLRIPTMLSPEEGRLLYWLSRDYALGAGAIVDLGCFIGGSTARLAAGAAAAGNRAEIHAYDHFKIRDAQKPRFLEPAGIVGFEGKNMLPAVQQILSPWSDNLVFHPGDLRQSDPPAGQIELLFIDAAKTPETTDAIASGFMTKLIPGRSLIIQQDYQHWRQPWVPAQMELLDGCFELVAWCQKGTAVFRCLATPEPEALARAATRELSDADLTRLLRAAIRRFPARAQRKRLACTILAIEDNPGVRLSYRYESKGFTAGRVERVLSAL